MIEEKECEQKIILAQFAGMMDCDGDIGIRKDNRQDTYYQRIGFTNTNIKIIEWIVENFGGSVPKETVRNNPRWKNFYKWTLGSSSSYKLLKKIRPYLIIKQEQADLAIELYDKVSKWNYGSGRAVSKLMPKHKREHAKELFEKCKTLNKKGKPDEEEVEILVPVKVRKEVLDEWL